MAENLNIYAGEPLTTGTCFVAPMGSSAPTKTDWDAGTYTLDAAWVDLGFIGEDGYTESKNISTDDKRAFGGGVVKTLQTDVTYEYSFTFLESLNANVLKAVYGASNVTVEAADATHGTRVEVQKTDLKLPHQMWVLDTMDSELGANYRSFLGDAVIIDVDDIQIVHSDVIMYAVKLRAYADDNGVYVYTWTNDGRPTTGT